MGKDLFGCKKQRPTQFPSGDFIFIRRNWVKGSPGYDTRSCSARLYIAVLDKVIEQMKYWESCKNADPSQEVKGRAQGILNKLPEDDDDASSQSNKTVRWCIRHPCSRHCSMAHYSWAALRTPQQLKKSSKVGFSTSVSAFLCSFSPTPPSTYLPALCPPLTVICFLMASSACACAHCLLSTSMLLDDLLILFLYLIFKFPRKKI